VIRSENTVWQADSRVDAPFVDVGRRDGRPQVSYSRCDKGPCELWRYDPETEREFGLPRTASANCRESAPALWRKTVVFYREEIPGSTCATGIYRQRGDERPRLVHRIRLGEQGGEGAGVKDMDIQGGAVAFLLYRDSESRHEVWLKPSASGDFRRVAAQVVYRPGDVPIHELDIAGRHVYWTTGSEEDGGDNRSKHVFRQPLSGARAERAVETIPFFRAAFTSTRFLYSDERGIYRTPMPDPWE
jgi:hypothetical protein